jgi:hypothetical protein
VEDHSTVASTLRPFIVSGRFYAFPTVLFYRSSRGLRPLAIRTNPGTGGYIVTPRNSAADWTFAKLLANSIAFFRIQFVDHFMESVSRLTWLHYWIIRMMNDANAHNLFFFVMPCSLTASCV